MPARQCTHLTTDQPSMAGPLYVTSQGELVMAKSQTATGQLFL